MLDLNDALPPGDGAPRYDLDLIVERLREYAEHWVPDLFPRGRRSGDEWRLANIRGEAPQLLEVGESGEFKRGTLGESKESYKVKTYGRVVAITRQTLINDDLDAFTRIPAMYGNSIAQLESDVVWGIITANPAMADGTALFHANHKNLAGTGAALAVDAVGAARAAMTDVLGRILEGQWRAPPEDVGGPPGFEAFLDAIADPNHPDHKDLLDWHGGPFDPNDIGEELIHIRFKRLAKARRRKT